MKSSYPICIKGCCKSISLQQPLSFKCLYACEHQQHDFVFGCLLHLSHLCPLPVSLVSALFFPSPCCQVKTEISVESKHQTLQGLAFPLQPEAQQAIQLLKQKKINYIQLVRRCCFLHLVFQCLAHFSTMPTR